MVWNLISNREVESSNPTVGDRAWEAMVGPTACAGNFRVVEVGSEESNYFIFSIILFYFIFFNNTILIKFRYKKKIKSRYGKDDVARKTH